jgi:hypothetical protein
MTVSLDVLHQSLAHAVERNAPLDFIYQGNVRIASPYLLGKTKDGRTVLHALQTGGFSSNGPVTKPVWRFFYTDEFGLCRYALDPFVYVALAKSEGTGEYKPPAFITEVIAIHPKE